MGPLVVFFLANSYGDELAQRFPALAELGGKIFIGTEFFMVAMVISLTITWVLERRIAIMPLITGVMVMVFGGLTLYLQDETFIKMKPTIVNTLFGTTLLILLLVFKKLESFEARQFVENLLVKRNFRIHDYILL